MTIEKAVSEEYITIYRPFITVKGKRIFARQKGLALMNPLMIFIKIIKLR
ncbi:hypothetical protein HEO89_020935 [Escherichia coli]|nr:hypothetical protein [Escherichia coli]MBB6777327.1 hypothetical protein [Escherichia coli]MBB8242584.1 hypothetical protein [Escherichia coli]MBB8532473.1 hypothetical protein [Escherichia coli]MBB8541476.1 hypothetical protein [Escherichia coli]